MRHPQLLIHERDGRFAALLQKTALALQWALREPRRTETCLHLLQRGGPSVLLLTVGEDPGPAFALLERVSWLHSEAATIVVLDEEQIRFAPLAWELGAAYVLPFAEARENLPELVAALLGTPGERLEQLRLEPSSDD